MAERPNPNHDLHRLRDLEESERLRQLGGIVVHDLNNALFALTGRVQILKRRATDPAVAKQADDILGAVRLLESQLASLHAACRRDDPGEGPSAARESLRIALVEAGLDAAGLDALPADLSFEGDPATLSTAVRQLAALHRSRGAAPRVDIALDGPSDAPRVRVNLSDDAGAWQHPTTAPSLLSQSFDLATLPLAAAHRAVRDFGGAVAIEPVARGLRTTLSFEVRRGIPLAAPRSTGANEACDHAAAGVPAPRVVLVADDDPAVRAVLVAALESVDDDVDTLADPSALDGVADLDRFDVVILDAGGGGLEALRRIRARGVSVPVLLASGGDVDGPLDPLTRFALKPVPIDRLDRELTALAALRKRR
jgi:CheY-like chemotaxis protein